MRKRRIHGIFVGKRLGRFPGIDLWHFLATSFRTGGISSLASLNKRVTR